MANHVINHLILPKNEAFRNAILDFLAGENGSRGEVDFNTLESMPDSVYRGPLGSEELARYPGEANWYNWSLAHWGTKWNAWDGNVSGCTLEFYTAWSPVPELMMKLSTIFPDVEFGYSWADEDIGFNVGSLVLKSGKVLSEVALEPGSAEAVTLARELWGIGDEEDEEGEDEE